MLPEGFYGLLSGAGVLLCCLWPLRMAALCGDEGSAYFMGALELAFFFFSLFGLGANRAVGLIIRFRLERGGVGDARMAARKALLFGLISGLVLSAVMLGAAKAVCQSILHLPLAVMAVRMLALSLTPFTLFWMLLGVLDAFGGGQAARALTGLFGLLLFVSGSAAAGPFGAYGEKVGALLQNASYGPAYGAKGAALAFPAASLVCLAAALAVWLGVRRSIADVELEGRKSSPAEPWLFRNVWKNALPVCVPGLCLAVGALAQTALYAGAESAGAWGVYEGKCRILHLILLAGALGLAARMTPELKVGFLNRNLRKSREKCMLALRCSALYLVPAAVLTAVLAEPLLRALFSAEGAGDVAGPLQVCSLSLIFGGLAFMMGAVLFAMEMYYSLWTAVAASTALRLGSFYVMQSLLKLQLYSPACAELLGSFVLCLLLIAILRRRLKISVSWLRILLAPCIGGAVTAAVCLLFSKLLLAKAPAAATVIVSMLVGLAVYFVLAVLLKGASRRELRLFPGGEYLVRAARLLRLL